jgi:hypothetical protein
MTIPGQPMRADNAHHIVLAARRRAEQARQRAITALRRMNATGAAINFDSLAREAGVSRSWLYTQRDLRSEIERLRERRAARSRPTVPIGQRSSDASLLNRLHAANHHIRRLENENRYLRQALAEALGERRAADIFDQTPRSDTPNKKQQKIIGSH